MSAARPLPPRLVAATHNAGKLKELRELLEPQRVEVVSAAELDLPEPEETGTTFHANAALKAHAAAQASGLPALSDDSGLVVDALGGDPGIHTARWAGPAKDFAAAMALVDAKLNAAGAVTDEARRARFVSVLALAWPDGHEQLYEGTVEGRIVWPPRGAKGFGYDPLFQPDGKTVTFGEMTAFEKHGLPPAGEALSHRARAFMALLKDVGGV